MTAARPRLHWSLYPGAAVLAVLLAAVLIQPSLEQGINDDFSYTRSAQVLAHTGHVVYNGWATAMLGWQLYLGAAFIRLFGDSFTSVRLSTLLVTVLTAWLIQRCFVRCGLTEPLALFGTLGVVFSPLVVPLAFSFMTDVPGMLVIVVCFYACLRVLESRTTTAQIAWLSCALITNAIGGTVRQTSWLGVLVLVPATLFVLRRNRTLLWFGFPATTLAVAFILGMLHWFHAQPYVLAESLLPPNISPRFLILNLLRAFFEAQVLLLPVLAGFLWPLFTTRRVRARLIVLGGTLMFLSVALLLDRTGRMAWVVSPTLPNIVTLFGVQDVSPVFGPQPVVLGLLARLGISGLAFAASCAALLSFLAWPGQPSQTDTAEPPAGHRPLLWLGAPFSIVYLMLLLPRASTFGLYDRYLVALLLFAVPALLKLYQQRVGPRLPVSGVAVLILFAGFAIAATHDFFSLYRARVAAIHEVEDAGVRANQIDGGFDFNASTELDRVGFLPDPNNAHAATRSPGPCTPTMGYLSPHLERHFSLASAPGLCDGSAPFPAVPYQTWLAPRQHAIYVVLDHGTYDDH